MSFYRFRVAIPTIGVAIAFSLIGSSGLAAENECKTLMNQIHQGIGLIEDFDKESQAFEARTETTKDPSLMVPVLNDFAELLTIFIADLGDVTQQLDALELQDETLVSFQQRYSSNLQTLNGLFGKLTQPLQEMAEVLEAISKTSPDRITPTQAKQWQALANQSEAEVIEVETNLQVTTGAIDKLADDVNRYCDREAPEAPEREDTAACSSTSCRSEV